MPRYIPRYNGMDFKNFVDAIESNYYPSMAFQRFINDSFEWEKTPQGHNFWSDINKEFSYISEVAFKGREYVVNISEETIRLIKLYYDNKEIESLNQSI